MSFDRRLAYLNHNYAMVKWKYSDFVGARASCFRMNCYIAYTSALHIWFIITYDVMQMVKYEIRNKGDDDFDILYLKDLNW